MAELKAKSDTNSLSTMAKQLLQIIALCESRICQATLLHLLKACGWGVAATKSGVLTQAHLKPDLKDLVDRGFLESRNAAMTFLEIATPWQDIAVQQAVQNGSFSLIVGAIEALDSELARDLTQARVSDIAVKKARRQARIAFYRGDVAAFTAAKQELAKARPELNNLGLLNPFDAELYALTPAELQPEVFLSPVAQSILTGVGSPEMIEEFDEFVNWHGEISDEIGELWVNCLTASGDLSGLQTLAESDHPCSVSAGGCLAFLAGQHDAAEVAFNDLTSRLRKATGKRNVVLPVLPGLMHILLLLRKTDPKSRAELKSFSAAAQTLWPPSLQLIPEILSVAVGYADLPNASTKAACKSALTQKPPRAVPLVTAMVVHIAKWFLPEESFTPSSQLAQAVESYEELGFGWLAALCEDAVAVCAKVSETKIVQGQLHVLLHRNCESASNATRTGSRHPENLSSMN